jgi:hypothetical protein
MAAELFRVSSTRLRGTPADISVDPYKMSFKLSVEELIVQGKSDAALPPDAEMANALSVLWLTEKFVF